MKKGLIFDMDGTLWDSTEQVAKSWNIAILDSAYPDHTITAEDMSRVMGLTMDKLAAGLFPDIEESQRMQLMEECCKVENDYLREHGANTYPKLEETMRQLQKEYHLYIVSNCQKGYIEAFLDHYGWWDLFEDIECFGNNGFPKGDNIRLVVERNGLDRAAYIGDIQGDYEATKAAGLPFIHAAYGFGKIADDVARIESLEELPKVAASLLA